MQGYVDLVGVRDGRLAPLDFKTDAPPEATWSRPTRHTWSRSGDYARILVALGLATKGSVDAGLLFTAEDAVRWVRAE